MKPIHGKPEDETTPDQPEAEVAEEEEEEEEVTPTEFFDERNEEEIPLKKRDGTVARTIVMREMDGVLRDEYSLKAGEHFKMREKEHEGEYRPGLAEILLCRCLFEKGENGHLQAFTEDKVRALPGPTRDALFLKGIEFNGLGRKARKNAKKK